MPILLRCPSSSPLFGSESSAASGELMVALSRILTYVRVDGRNALPVCSDRACFCQPYQLQLRSVARLQVLGPLKASVRSAPGCSVDTATAT